MINILVYIFLIGILLWYYHIREQRKFGHVPGPKKLPFLGNILQFRKKDSTGKPIPLAHMLTDIWKQYGGVMWVKLGSTNHIILSSYDAIHEALVQKGADFADRPSSYRRSLVRNDKSLGLLNYTPKFKLLKNLMLASFKDYGNGREKMEEIFHESLQILISDIEQMEGKSFSVKQQVQAAFVNVIHIMVITNLWALHHDPDFWTDPWTFLPKRFLDEDGVIVPPDHPNRKRLLPFGAGQRVCAAEVFALNRLFLFLVTLVQKFQFVADKEKELVSHDPRTWKTSIDLIPPSVMARFIPRPSD